MIPNICIRHKMRLIVEQLYGIAFSTCNSLPQLEKLKFSRQQIDGDWSSYTCLLSGYVRFRIIEEAMSIHAHTIKTQRQPHISFWNNLVYIYAKKGNLTDALQVFDKMPLRNSVSWNAMIAGYVQHGYGKQALTLFSQMHKMQGMEGDTQVKPNEFTFSSVVGACASLATLQEGKQVHASALKSGYYLDVYGGSALVDMYGKCGQLGDAQQVFDKMPQRSVISWNALIAGYGQNGHGEEALKLYFHMLWAGIKPTEFTFSAILIGRSSIEVLEGGKQVHAMVIKHGFQSNVFVGSMLVDMYIKWSSLEDGILVFETMPERNIVSWTMVIAGYAQHHLIYEVIELFKHMQLEHIGINQFTINSILSACAVPEGLYPGKQVHALVIKNGFDLATGVGPSLVTMYAKCSSVASFAKVFEEIPEPDVVSWNAMIGGYVQNGCNEEALQYFALMHQTVMMADIFTFASVLKACASLAILEQGKQVHAHVIKSGCDSHDSVQNCLVTMYSRSGSVDDARQVFVNSPGCNIVSWNALIAACARHGLAKEALLLFEQMREVGVKPDHISFIGVLSACSHAGLLDEGCKYFDSMSKYHCITPGMEHYSCMVDLLGRGGHLDKAEAFIHAMPLKPTGLVWKALLSACRVHGNMAVGKRAAESLLQVDPQDAASYVLLANIFAVDGKWGDVARMRKMMTDRSVKKEPGCSWIEINKRVHAFVTQDRSHELTNIYANRDCLSGKMGEEGYLLFT